MIPIVTKDHIGQFVVLEGNAWRVEQTLFNNIEDVKHYLYETRGYSQFDRVDGPIDLRDSSNDGPPYFGHFAAADYDE